MQLDLIWSTHSAAKTSQNTERFVSACFIRGSELWWVPESSCYWSLQAQFGQCCSFLTVKPADKNIQSFKLWVMRIDHLRHQQIYSEVNMKSLSFTVGLLLSVYSCNADCKSVSLLPAPDMMKMTLKIFFLIISLFKLQMASDILSVLSISSLNSINVCLCVLPHLW